MGDKQGSKKNHSAKPLSLADIGAMYKWWAKEQNMDIPKIVADCNNIIYVNNKANSKTGAVSNLLDKFATPIIIMIMLVAFVFCFPNHQAASMRHNKHTQLLYVMPMCLSSNKDQEYKKCNLSSNMCAELFWLVIELHNALEANLANDKPAMPLAHNLSSLPSTFLTRGLYVSVSGSCVVNPITSWVASVFLI